jgi:uncharacterized protein (TIRG00374 family)
MKQLLKILITLVLFAWVVWLIDYHELEKALRHLNFGWYGAAFVIFLTGIILATLVWWVLIKPLSIKVTFTELVKLNLICAFINNIFPAGVVGDFKKAMDLSIITKQPAQAWASVLVERVVCGTANLVLIITGLVLALNYFKGLPLGLPLNYLLILIFLPLGIWIFRKEISKAFQKDIFTEFFKALSLYLRSWQTVAASLLPGFISPLLESLAVFVLAYALGLQVPFLSFIFLIPANRILSALSLAINNIGPQDAAFVLILGYFNLDTTQAFTLSILLHSLRIFSGLVGGIFFALQMKGQRAIRK